MVWFLYQQIDIFNAKRKSLKALEFSESNLKSIVIDPKLIFPRYKLSKLYIAKHDTIKTCKVATAILNMKIKVKSNATNEIQAEMVGISSLCK